MDRESELALVAGLRAGNAAAFDEVYEAYRPRVFSFLCRLARQPDVAEDLLEEVWLRLVTRARDLQPDTRIAAWLFTVARNLYLSYCRSRHVEEEYSLDLIGLWPAPSWHPSPFDEAAASELDERVERALATLRAPYREALLLVAVHGLTPAEAAGVCGIAPEALRTRLSRARAMLAEVLRQPMSDLPGRRGDS
jgi:RNA polymerase sigma-70 factor (ECF subfamily)